MNNGSLDNLVQGEFAFVKQIDYQAYMNAQLKDAKTKYIDHMNKGGPAYTRNAWLKAYIHNNADDFRRQNGRKYRQESSDTSGIFYFPR